MNTSIQEADTHADCRRQGARCDCVNKIHCPAFAQPTIPSRSALKRSRFRCGGNKKPPGGLLTARDRGQLRRRSRGYFVLVAMTAGPAKRIGLGSCQDGACRTFASRVLDACGFTSVLEGGYPRPGGLRDLLCFAAMCGCLCVRCVCACESVGFGRRSIHRDLDTTPRPEGGYYACSPAMRSSSSMRSTSFLSIPFLFVSLGASLSFAGTKACSWGLLATVATPDFLVYCNRCLNLKWNSLCPVLQSPTFFFFPFFLREHPTAPVFAAAYSPPILH